MGQKRVFVDSDVVISSLLSSTGAAHFLLHADLKKIKFFVSNLSLKEQKMVIGRLKIKKSNLNDLIKKHFSLVELKEPVGKIKSKYKQYVFDPNDAHIVAGALKAKANYLVTYNQKDYQPNKIKKDFGIILLTPAQFLQYLRSKR